MTRNSLGKAMGAVMCGALPVVTAVALAAPAAADPATGQATPVAGIPVQQNENTATNPEALIPDPVLNGSSAGQSLGSAVGSATGTGSAASVLGSAIGALVGYLHPEVVPQTLP